jgi:hypothetical protein
MAATDRITMTMRELDRFKVIQSVITVPIAAIDVMKKISQRMECLLRGCVCPSYTRIQRPLAVGSIDRTIDWVWFVYRLATMAERNLRISSFT